jgi:hypothetical protein
MRSFVLILVTCVGCADPELRDACAAWCVERTACDEEKGDVPSDTCESSCVQFESDDFVDRHAGCADLASCEYTVCVTS